MTAIYKRELKAYFHSFIGSLFVGATLFILGIYVTVYNLLMAYPSLSYAVSSIVFLFLISIPILTMRILAEERRQKTDQMILTAPVSVAGIVIGKYLAIATVFAIPVAVICIYPLILSFFGTVAIANSYIAILGFFLYGLASIAICMFVSSITESQVIAAVISFALLLVAYLMSGICSIISETGNLLTKILGCLDMSTRFSNMMDGSLRIDSVVYFFSIIALFIVFTMQSIQKRRFSVSTGTIGMGAYSSSTIVLATAIVVVLNLFVAELPSTVTSIDLTSNHLYSLTEDTKELVSGLTEDIDLYVLVNEGQSDTTVGDTLQRYDDLSDHIKVTYVDPTVNPQFYTTYSDASLSANSIIVASAKRSKVINYSDLYETEYDYTTGQSTTSGYDAEGQITSALDYVTSESMPKIYMIEGHGELTYDTSFTSAIEKENVEYETINLMDYDTIPEDARAVVINAPTSDFSEDDMNKMLDYMNAGGDVFLTATYTGTDMSHFNQLLAFYGVSVTNGLVVETSQDQYYQNPFYLLPTIQYDTITQNAFSSSGYIFAPYAQGLTYEEQEDVTVTELLVTSDAAFARADVENMTSYDKQEGDTDGPFAIGMTAAKTVGEEESVGVIFSCEALFTTDADSIVSGNNMQIFSGVIGTFADHETSVSIAVKTLDNSYLTVSQQTAVLLGILITLILPLTVLGIGFVIWFRRRRQ